MRNLLREVNIVSRLIEQNTDELENLIKYHQEIITRKYKSRIEYQKEETCIDYMSFMDYNKEMSAILKQIVEEILGSIKNKEATIKKLTFLKEYLIYKAIFLSRLSITEFMEIISLFHYQVPSYIIEENKEYIEIFAKQDGELNINVDICSYPKELIDFLIYLVNEKSKDISIDAKEAYQNYQSGKEKNR